jgi:hypothetical protein
MVKKKEQTTTSNEGVKEGDTARDQLEGELEYSLEQLNKRQVGGFIDNSVFCLSSYLKTILRYIWSFYGLTNDPRLGIMIFATIEVW